MIHVGHEVSENSGRSASAVVDISFPGIQKGDCRYEVVQREDMVSQETFS